MISFNCLCLSKESCTDNLPTWFALDTVSLVSSCSYLPRVQSFIATHWHRSKVGPPYWCLRSYVAKTSEAMFHLRRGYACQDAGIGTHWYSIRGSLKLLLQRLLGNPDRLLWLRLNWVWSCLLSTYPFNKSTQGYCTVSSTSYNVIWLPSPSINTVCNCKYDM